MSGLTSSRSDAAMHGEFMGFALDEASLAVLRQWCDRQGFPASCVVQGGLDGFSRALDSSAPPKLALVDMDGQEDAPAAVARLLAANGQIRILAFGSANDVSLYRKLTHSGALDYLVKPLSLDTLAPVALAALRGEKPSKPGAPKESRLVVVLGARGGVGASTLALNIGWECGHTLGLKTVLLDLDLQFGTGSLALDLEPSRGLRDLVSSPHRVDGLMIAGALMPESEKFSLLAAEEPVDESLLIDSAAIAALTKELKGKFETLIVDLPPHYFPLHKRLVAAAHEIVLVSDLSLAGIRDTLRFKSSIAALGCPARLTIVAARTNSDGIGQIDAAAFEKGIQGKIDLTLPEDKTAFAAAANSGKALAAVNANSEAAKAIRKLARRLANLEETVGEAPSLWAKLLGKGGARSGA